MATTEHKPSRRAILGALATTPIFAGTIGASLAGIEPAQAAEAESASDDELNANWLDGHDCGADLARSEFARSWLRYWRSIGNAVIAHGEERAFYVVDMALDELPLRTDLEPHLSLWTREHHEGATRALLTLLDSVPGGRDAVFTLVQIGG